MWDDADEEESPDVLASDDVAWRGDHHPDSPDPATDDLPQWWTRLEAAIEEQIERDQAIEDLTRPEDHR